MLPLAMCHSLSPFVDGQFGFGHPEFYLGTRDFFIAGFVLFSVFFLIVQLFRKDYARYGVFLVIVAINAFLLFGLPYLVS